MNLGRKKSTSLEPPERSLETSSKTHSRLLGQRAGSPRWAAARLQEGSSVGQGRDLGFCSSTSWASEPTVHGFC